IALKACRILDTVLFLFPETGAPASQLDAQAQNHPDLSIRKVGEIWILKNNDVAIAQFNLRGQPIAIRSSHDGASPSSQWLKFQYDDSGRLSEIGFGFHGEPAGRLMANVHNQSAKIIFKENTNMIQEIRTPLSSVRYFYKGNHLAQTQDGQTKRSPD
ncbi:MAG: hypothetical protein K2X47_15185, partial [Bdellovibrionales bacterium]|nr:hypothetical protein [Bdellovibrionales bacterium]